MKTLTINNQEREAKAIAFDTCHKIYLINTEEAEAEAIEYGYKLYEPTAESLQGIWEDSCSLKFIQTWESFENVIPQAYEGEVTIR